MISANSATVSPIASATRRPVDREATPRQMRLTPELVARVARHVDDPGPIAGRAYATDADYEACVPFLAPDRRAARRRSSHMAPWKPACDIVEQRVAVAQGWHRAFCLGWDRRFRGSTERPGLMLALDHGGTCKGGGQRLPHDAVEASLGKLLRREMLIKPSPFAPRWVSVQTAAGPLRAITFAMDRRSEEHSIVPTPQARLTRNVIRILETLI